MLAIDQDGVTIAYRKMWLGGAEPDHFVAGTEPAAIEIDGWRLGLAICRDTGIGRHAAGNGRPWHRCVRRGVLEFASDAAVPGERARRIAAEHRVWVAIASFAGSTGGGYDRAAGDSGIWSPDGVAVAEAGPEVGAIARAMISDVGAGSE